MMRHNKYHNAVRRRCVFFLAVSVLMFSNGQGAWAKKGNAELKIHYNIKNLPSFVQKMRREIYRAARSGDLEMMRTVLETNELLPLVGDKLVRKPVDHWIRESVASDGLSIFAAMSKILEAGYVKRKGKNGEALYIWPYFAETDLKKLEDHQKVQLYRTVSSKDAAAMLKSGKYTSYSLGIGEDGTWHFFRKN